MEEKKKEIEAFHEIFKEKVGMQGADCLVYFADTYTLTKIKTKDLKNGIGQIFLDKPDVKFIIQRIREHIEDPVARYTDHYFDLLAIQNDKNIIEILPVPLLNEYEIQVLTRFFDNNSIKVVSRDWLSDDDYSKEYLWETFYPPEE